MIEYQFLLKTSLFLLLFGSVFSYRIYEGIALSNLVQIFSVLIMFYLAKSHSLVGVFNYAIVSFFIVLAYLFSHVAYGVDFKLGFFVFFSFSFFYIYWLYSNRKEYDVVKLSVNYFISISIFISFYLILYFFYDFVLNENFITSYGFDDKSHAVLYIYFIIYLLSKNLQSFLSNVLILVLIVLSLFTASRLVVLFLPFLFFYYLGLVDGLYKKLFLILVSVVLAVSFVYSFYEYFHLFSRFDSDNSASNASTSSHMLLIYYAFILKFESFFNFFLGIGPGQFNEVLVASSIDFKDFLFVEPRIYYGIIDKSSYVPIHSTHMTFFLEFPFYFFVLYSFLNVYIFFTLISRRCYLDSLFFILFSLAVSFYSSLNELFYYAVIFFFFAYSFVVRVESDLNNV